MVARNATIFKWTLYILAALLCFFAQGLLQRLTFWGVIPFLFPLVAAIPATYEDSLFGTAFALVVGIVADLLLPAPLPCFYTLVFPLTGLCAALIGRGSLRSGLLCSLTGSAIAFLLTGGFHCLLLWVSRRTAWSVSGYVLLREMLVTLPLVFPVNFLFRAVSRRVHIDD